VQILPSRQQRHPRGQFRVGFGSAGGNAVANFETCQQTEKQTNRQENRQLYRMLESHPPLGRASVARAEFGGERVLPMNCFGTESFAVGCVCPTNLVCPARNTAKRLRYSGSSHRT
jgi:hypothetical protein